MADSRPFVSRGGLKLDHALVTFGIGVSGLTCADLGCSTGGFTDCLLQRGARAVFAVDTGYGVLDWTLRTDPRVVVLERTNAMHVRLPQPVDLVVIDAGWTRQKHILGHAVTLLAPSGRIVTLVKPHYEGRPSQLRNGVLPEEQIEPILAAVRDEVERLSLAIRGETRSPIRGSKGNMEFLFLLEPR